MMGEKAPGMQVDTENTVTVSAFITEFVLVSYDTAILILWTTVEFGL